MSRIFRASAIAAVCLCAGVSVSMGASIIDGVGRSASDRGSYYGRNAEGWYWYQDPQEEIKEPSAEPPPPPPPAHEETPEPESLPVMEAPAHSEKPLSAKWVRDMLPKYRDLMWSEPTPENVKAYFLLQRFAIDRSQKVAEVAQEVTLGNPLLDETFRRPTASFGINAVDRTAGMKMDEVLAKIAKKAGLFFFFKSDCRFCEAEAPLIGTLEQKGFDVLAISLDGGALETYPFKNLRLDQGHAQQLGVTATPAMFLVSGDGQFESLGQGLLALPELRRRIVVAASRQGWIDEADLESTKPIINPESQIDLSKELPKLLLASQNPALSWGSAKGSETVATMPETVFASIADKDGFISPANLVNLFNGADTSGQFNPQLLDNHAPQN